MSTFYRLFLMNVATSHPLPGLTAAKGHVPVDVRVDFFNSGASGKPISETESLFYEARPGPENVLPAVRVWRREHDGRLRLRYEDGTEFLVAADGSRIRAIWPAPLTLEDTAVYLLGPVMGLVLRLRGIICLHASAVLVDGRAVAFMAPGGSGKSTLAASFAAGGFPVLTDDILTIEVAAHSIVTRPAYPMLRLWPKAVSELFSSHVTLPRLSPQHPTWDKCYLASGDLPDPFPSESVPLGAVYTGKHAEKKAEPCIEQLSPQSALLALIANSYGSYFLDKSMRGREFEMLALLAETMPVRRVRAQSFQACSPDRLRAMVYDDYMRSDRRRQ